MIEPNTSVKALVPCAVSQYKQKVFWKKALFRISSEMDKLFASRKALYLIGVVFLSFGILLGAYYSALTYFQIDLSFFLNMMNHAIPIALFTGLTIFGIACVPLIFLGGSFLFGCLSGVAMFSSAQKIVCFAIFLIYFLQLSLFLAEAFCSSVRSLKGCRAMFCSRSCALLFSFAFCSFALGKLCLFFLLKFC